MDEKKDVSSQELETMIDRQVQANKAGRVKKQTNLVEARIFLEEAQRRLNDEREALTTPWKTAALEEEIGELEEQIRNLERDPYQRQFADRVALLDGLVNGVDPKSPYAQVIAFAKGELLRKGPDQPETFVQFMENAQSVLDRVAKQVCSIPLGGTKEPVAYPHELKVGDRIFDAEYMKGWEAITGISHTKDGSYYFFSTKEYPIPLTVWKEELVRVERESVS